jgi:hypothetical protein
VTGIPRGATPKYEGLPVAKISTRDLEQGARRRLFELARPGEVTFYKPRGRGTFHWVFVCAVGGCAEVRSEFVHRHLAVLALIEHRADCHSLLP